MTAQQILEQAIREVAERTVTHGDKHKVFADIAKLWVAYLTAVNPKIADKLMLDGQDAAAMMALFKIARIANNKGHVDSYVDLAGYAACAGEMAK